MHPRERFAFQPIEGRPPLKLPDGVRLVVWPVFSLEDWDLARPMARMVITPPQGQPQIPDLPNWSWHEYGMRVAFWRLRRMFERIKAKPTVAINAKICETYAPVVQACIDSGWELNAHSYEQIPMHKLEDQRAIIGKTMDVIEKFSGKRPRGWFGPGLTQTFDTLDYLAEAGVEYIGDYVLDDDPVTLKTKHGNMVALPYTFEVHDIVMMNLQHHASEEFHTRAMDHFRCLYAESADRAKIMAISCHPYLSGVPHRIGHVERTFTDILGARRRRVVDRRADPGLVQDAVVVMPGLVPGIHPSTDAGASRALDPGDKHRDDRQLVKFWEAAMQGTVGVVGLGIMGGAFARNLIADGWTVIGYDPDITRSAEARAAGVELVHSARSAGRDRERHHHQPADCARSARYRRSHRPHRRRPAHSRRGEHDCTRRQDEVPGDPGKSRAHCARLPGVWNRRAGRRQGPRRLRQRRQREHQAAGADVPRLHAQGP